MASGGECGDFWFELIDSTLVILTIDLSFCVVLVGTLRIRM